MSLGNYWSRMGPRYFGETPTFCDVLLAIFLPPLGVFLGYRFQKEFWIDLVMTLLGYIPGILYALYVLLRKDEVPLNVANSSDDSPPSTYV